MALLNFNLLFGKKTVPSVLVKNVTFNFVTLFRARAYMQNAPEFSVTATFEQGSPAHEAIQEAVRAAALEKFGPKAGELLEKGKIDSPIRATEDVNYFDDGLLFFRAKTREDSSRPRNGAPAIVDAKRNPITDPEDCYSGCTGNLNVVVKAYDYNGKKGVGCYLQGVQVVKKGERLDGNSGASAFAEEDGFEVAETDGFGFE